MAEQIPQITTQPSEQTRRFAILASSVTVVIGVSFLILWLFGRFNANLLQGQRDDYFLQAETALDEERYTDAFNLFGKAQQLDPDNTEITLRMGDTAFLAGDYQTAITLYNQVQSTPALTGVVYYQALQNISQANYETAIATLTPLTSITTDIFTIQKVNDLIARITEIQKTTNAPLQEALAAKLLLDENANTLAQTVLTELTINQPNYRDAFYLLGFTENKLGNTASAQVALERSLEIDPNYAPARELLEQIKPAE